MISRTELETLAQQRGDVCVSLFMPTVRLGQEIQQNPIRLKNLLDKAETQLRDEGLETPEIDSLLQPARQLTEVEIFWQQQSDGLAIFLAPDVSRVLRLPLDFESLVVATDHFHLKPLFPLLINDGQFYILALSQTDVRLFEGSHYSVDEIEVEDLPASVYELLDYEEMERHVQFHSRTRTPSGKPPGTTPAPEAASAADRPAAFHGQSVAEEDEKQDIRKYFQHVDDALKPFLEDNRRPLVLAGVDFLLPLYREVNSYPHLAEDEIEGSPKTWDAERLHEEAWEIVKTIFAEEKAEVKQRYKELKANAPSRTAQDVAEVVPAAYFERIDTLFVEKNAHRWGTFDPETNDVIEHDEQQPGDEDLLDLATIHTFLNSGRLFMLSADEMPEQVPVAAIFRY